MLDWCGVWPKLHLTDLDFADDVSLLAELLELLCCHIGEFEVNWQKTKVQALGCR